MADRGRKGIWSESAHDQRSTRKPQDDDNMAYHYHHHYGSSFEDTAAFGLQQQSDGRTINSSSSSAPRVRDSGYNTDVSPARTSSSTSTPAELFSFDYPEQISSICTTIGTSPRSATREIPVRPKSSPPSSRSTVAAIPSSSSSSSQSPDISTSRQDYYFADRYQVLHNNVSKSAPGGHDYIKHPPPSILFDDVNPDSIVADDEGEDEIDGWMDPSPSTSGQNLSVLPKKMSNSFQDLRGSDEGEVEGDDVMTSSEEKEMEERFIYSNVKRMSLRKRNYSGPDEKGTAAASAVCPTEECTYRFSDDDLGRDYMEQTSPELAYSIKNTCQLMMGLHIDPACDDVTRRAPNSSQDIVNREPFANDDIEDEDSNFDNEEIYGMMDSDEGDEEVFSFDAEDIKNYEESSSGSNSCHSADTQFSLHTYDPNNSISVPARSPAAIPMHIVSDRPPISPSSRGRQGKARPARAIPTRLQLAGGARLPWEEGGSTTGSASSATQTPHRTSTMIQDIVSTPVALPNEARGTAYMHLRRGSADISTLLRAHHQQPVNPLPDIVPMGRDRAQSVPNLQDIIMRRRARNAGRELRRLSDLFHENVVRRNSVNSEDNDSHQASSYPKMGPSFLLKEKMKSLVYASWSSLSAISRRGSSVDDMLDKDHDDDSDYSDSS